MAGKQQTPHRSSSRRMPAEQVTPSSTHPAKQKKKVPPVHLPSGLYTSAGSSSCM